MEGGYEKFNPFQPSFDVKMVSFDPHSVRAPQFTASEPRPGGSGHIARRIAPGAHGNVIRPGKQTAPSEESGGDRVSYSGRDGLLVLRHDYKRWRIWVRLLRDR